MILPDVNLLVFAVDATSPFHARARAWWEGVLSSPRRVGLTYPSILGFVRLTTHRRVFASPLRIDEALGYVNGWLEQPNVSILLPTERHWQRLSQVLRALGAGGNLTTDAHLAVLALEHGCTLQSNDADFARFAGLQWEDPLRA